MIAGIAATRGEQKHQHPRDQANPAVVPGRPKLSATQMAIMKHCPRFQDTRRVGHSGRFVSIRTPRSLLQDSSPWEYQTPKPRTICHDALYGTCPSRGAQNQNVYRVSYDGRAATYAVLDLVGILFGSVMTIMLPPGQDGRSHGSVMPQAHLLASPNLRLS
jgi:hypothetical protein